MNEYLFYENTNMAQGGMETAGHHWSNFNLSRSLTQIYHKTFHQNTTFIHKTHPYHDQQNITSSPS